MPSNGELSKKLGVYKTVCCDAEIFILVGVVFPDCPNHVNLPTQWKELTDVDPTVKKVMRISFLFPALPSNGVIVARCIGALEICG